MLGTHSSVQTYDYNIKVLFFTEPRGQFSYRLRSRTNDLSGLEWLMNTVYSKLRSNKVFHSFLGFLGSSSTWVLKMLMILVYGIKSLPETFSCIVGTTLAIREFRERFGGRMTSFLIFLTRAKLKILKKSSKNWLLNKACLRICLHRSGSSTQWQPWDRQWQEVVGQTSE